MYKRIETTQHNMVSGLDVQNIMDANQKSIIKSRGSLFSKEDVTNLFREVENLLVGSMQPVHLVDNPEDLDDQPDADEIITTDEKGVIFEKGDKAMMHHLSKNVGSIAITTNMVSSELKLGYATGAIEVMVDVEQLIYGDKWVECLMDETNISEISVD